MATAELPAITRENYHQAHGMIGHSMVETFRKSPLLYWARHVGFKLEPPPATDAMNLGTALHCFLLEPDKYNERIVVAPALAPDGKKWYRRKGSDHERWWQEFEESCVGKLALSVEQRAAVPQMAISIWENDPASRLLKAAGPCESPVVWRDSGTDLACKCLPDKLVDDARLIVNLKTARDASPAAFARAVVNFGYHRAEAFYRDGLKAATGEDHTHCFIVVANEPPYECAVYDLDDDAVSLGREENERLLDKLAAYYAKGPGKEHWQPPQHGTVTRLSLPRWAGNNEWEVSDGNDV